MGNFNVLFAAIMKLKYIKYITLVILESLHDILDLKLSRDFNTPMVSEKTSLYQKAIWTM